MLKLKSIEEEAADCRAAWAACPNAFLARHLHHKTLVELVTEPIENRIRYILDSKPVGEQALRLRLLRPFVGNLPAKLTKAYAEWEKADAEWEKAYAEWEKAYAEWEKAYAEWEKADAEAAHKEQCPDCPWDGETIFA